MKNNDFGKMLKELRKEERLTQRKLGTDLYVGTNTISNWESGQREPDFDTLVEIAKYFEVTTDYLLGCE